MSGTFFPRDDAELGRLSDEEVIAYVLAARAAGRADHVRRALQILVYGYWDIVRRRVALKVPEQYVEDITDDAIASALTAAFDGESAGELHSWLHTIVDRRVADFHRRKGRPQATVSLDRDPEERPGPAPDPPAPSEEGVVEIVDAVERVLRGLREDHRRVVELVIFQALPAPEAAAAIDGMTDQNAHQIVRRFRKALKAELGD